MDRVPHSLSRRRLSEGWPDFPRPFEDDGDRLLIAGDWHGSAAWGRRVVDTAADLGAGTVVAAGDHKILWPGQRRTLAALESRCAERQVRVVAVPGNHDWWPALNRLPRQADGFARITPWIWHVPRSTRWEVLGVRFAALGGAYSVDRDRLIEGRSWWPQELIEQDDVDALGDDPVDVLVTHEAPTGVSLTSSLVLDDRDRRISTQQRDLVRQAVERTRPSLVFHGHWHQRATNALSVSGETPVTVVGLSQEWTSGNWVLLDLPDMTVRDPRTPGFALMAERACN